MRDRWSLRAPAVSHLWGSLRPVPAETAVAVATEHAHVIDVASRKEPRLC